MHEGTGKDGANVAGIGTPVDVPLQYLSPQLSHPPRRGERELEIPNRSAALAALVGGRVDAVADGDGVAGGGFDGVI